MQPLEDRSGHPKSGLLIQDACKKNVCQCSPFMAKMWNPHISYKLEDELL
jgi:hypothetical protein